MLNIIFVFCRCSKYLSTRSSLLGAKHCTVMRLGTQSPWFLWCRAGLTGYLMLLWKKDESGLALCQEHFGAFLCLLGPRENHGSPPVVVLVFLLPVDEMSFGSKEKWKIRGGTRGVLFTFLIWSTHFLCGKDKKSTISHFAWIMKSNIYLLSIPIRRT